MKINNKIHNRNHILKSLLGNTEYLLTKLKLDKEELIVVNYHGTPKKFVSNFRNQLNFFQKVFSIISPEQLNDFYEGKLNELKKPKLLLTFDDGIKNNLLAAEVLKEFNIKAFFFVVPDFIDTVEEKQKEYFITNIRPSINSNIDSEAEDFTAISWIDLRKLQKEGHSIGSHTQTHKLIAKTSTLENSKVEIKDSRENIVKQLQTSFHNIGGFCSINNTLESISKKEILLIKENYQYHFTTIPGPNYSNSNKFFIKRANMESHWLLGAVKYAIGKWDLKRWKTSENSYLELLK